MCRNMMVIGLMVWSLAATSQQALATPQSGANSPQQESTRAPKHTETGSTAGSQTGTPASGTPSTAPNNLPPPYLLAGEDVIEITVVNFPMFNGRQTIPPDGHLSVSLLEPILILGKTTGEVAQILTEKWKKYVVNPSVTVSLVSRRRENVLLYGHLTKAGTLEYRQGMRVMEALAELGGQTPGADMVHVVLTRRTGERQILDLSHPETTIGGPQDMPLLPGDVVFVPERHTQITVLGEIGKPGTQDYQEDMTVLQALTAFGGVKETANLAGATLLRDGKEQPVDLEALLRRGDLNANLKLQAGDRLMVPEIRTRIYIFGNVRQPGFYTFKEGDRVLSALSLAGGTGQNADLARINVIHINKEKNKGMAETANIEKLGTRGDMKGNFLLQSGDAIYVPDKRKSFNPTDLLGVLTGLSLLDSVGRIFTKGLGN